MLWKPLVPAMAVSAIAAAAFAADLPSRAAPPPAYVPPLPVFTWSGFYIGVNAGGTFSGSSQIALTPSSSFGPFVSGFDAAQAIGAYPLALTSRRTSFIGGGQAGFNWQFGAFVAGVEADVQGLANRQAISATLFNPAPPPANFGAAVFGTASVTRGLDYLGTVRGRFGVAFDRAVIYATGGLAYGRTDLTYSGRIFFPVAPTVFLAGASTNNRTSIGYTLGGGVEYALWNNWSIKGEYLYYDLGRHSTVIGGTYTNFAPATGGFSTASVRENGHVLRAGVNYRFNWGVPAPVVARY